MVELSDHSDFVSFEVDTMSIPVHKIHSELEEFDFDQLPERELGKDVVIDWSFDNFDSKGDLWYDANGL
jgi:hypothetical protein